MKKRYKVSVMSIGLILTLLVTLSYAGLTHFPNGITSFGVPVLGGGPIVTTGDIYFVHSVTGSNGNDGKNPDTPFKTIEYAIETACTTNNGDYVVVMPGHSETVTSAIAWSKSNITLIGVGPLPSSHLLTTATAAINLIDMTGDNNVIKNMKFTNTAAMISGQYELLDIDGSYITIENCILDASSNRVEGINCLTGKTDIDIIGCKFMGATGSQADIAFDSTRIKVERCVFDFSNGNTGLATRQITAGTGAGFLFSNNIIQGTGTAQVYMSWGATVGAGISVIRNYLTDNAASTNPFGNDADLDYQFIGNMNGQTAGAETVIDPSVSY